MYVYWPNLHPCFRADYKSIRFKLIHQPDFHAFWLTLRAIRIGSTCKSGRSLINRRWAAEPKKWKATESFIITSRPTTELLFNRSHWTKVKFKLAQSIKRLTEIVLMAFINGLEIKFYLYCSKFSDVVLET